MARHDGKGISSGKFLAGFFGVLLAAVLLFGIGSLIGDSLNPAVEFETTDLEFGTKVYGDIVYARPEYKSTSGTIFCRCLFANGQSALVGFEKDVFATYFSADLDNIDPNRNYEPVYALRIYGDIRHSEPDGQLEGQSWIYCSGLERRGD